MYVVMSSSEEIQKLHDEIKELKLCAYQKQLEQKKKKLLKGINNNNEEDNETNNEHDDECEVTGDEREAEKTEIYTSVLGAILSYMLLILFMFSTFFIIAKLRQNGCNDVQRLDMFMKLKKKIEEAGYEMIMTDPDDDNRGRPAVSLVDIEITESEDEDSSLEVKAKQLLCQVFLEHTFDNNNPMVTLHNLTFGLVSAVVVSQIGRHQQQQQSHQKNKSINKLANMLLHATESTPGSRIVSRLVYNFITWTPRIYIVTWIFTGCACLLCGSIWGFEYSGPLYVTGQAWLGVAITTAYLFFGLQETAKENNNTKKEKDSDVDEHNDDNNDDSGVDSIDADCSKHNDKNEEFELDQEIGNLSSMAGEINTVTSSALIQTATSRCRFVEEKDDDDKDEEEGTLYLTGTKSNDKRNDAYADNSYFTQVKSLFTHTHQPSIS